VGGDAVAHLVVERLRGGDVEARRQTVEQALGITALAGAGAAEDEGEAGQGGAFDGVGGGAYTARWMVLPVFSDEGWKMKRERGATPRLPPQL